MTYLIVKRLVVIKDSTIVYDEHFHQGVNIIRGENGSGKSTIANFIYYGLGGDFIDWLPEAKLCDFVYIEVEVNDLILTLRREVLNKIMQPMQIFLGNLDDSMKSPLTLWQNFPYKKTSKTISFSTYLFNALNFPDVTTDNNENITINQILRLIYIDQISPLDSLMKEVDFDSPLIRRSIGYLLLGIYDDSLFGQQIELREKRKELSELEREFSAIREVYQNSNQSIDVNKVDQELREAEDHIKRIDETLKNREIIVKNANAEQLKKIQNLRTEVENISQKLSDTLRTKRLLEADIVDSREFVQELKKQSVALDESSFTREIFGALALSYCPSCLSKLENTENPDVCQLCKQEINIEDHKLRIFKIKSEISNQIKESEYLISKKNNDLQEKEVEIKELKNRYRLENNNLNSYIDQTASKIERQYDEILIKKGELRNQIINLINQKTLITSFLNVANRRDRLKSQVSQLEDTVKYKEDLQKKRESTAIQKIQYYALELIRGDGKYEESFVNATSIYPDFYRNTYSVNGRNNFSASSLVILKNAIRFGIFFASLDLDFMRYPRFILCDNIEDKGMREERSHTFQKNLVQIASKFQTRYQIIFTTSMIAEKLDIPSYTIGDYYTPDHKSLHMN